MPPPLAPSSSVGADRLHHLLRLPPTPTLQLLALLLPHPHRHPAPGGWHPRPYRHLAPAGRRTAPTPFGLTAGRRLAFVGLTADRGLDLQRLPDGNHALASVGPTADRQPRPPSKPAPLFQPRHPAPKQLMQLLLRFFYSSSVLSIFSSSSVLPPRLPACCSHECSTIGCCAGLVFISAYRSPSV